MSQKEREQRLSEMPIFVMSLSLERRRRSSQGFSHLRGALAYIAAEQRGIWHICASLEVGIKGRLTSDEHREYVRLTLGRRESVVPRYTPAHPDGIRVSTDGGTVFDIFIPVAAPNDNVFDRGLFWVSASDPKKAFLETTILPNHGLSDNELVQRYIQAQRTTMHRINDLFNGRCLLPNLPSFLASKRPI